MIINTCSFLCVNVSHPICFYRAMVGSNSGPVTSVDASPLVEALCIVQSLRQFVIHLRGIKDK